ncbi:MAG: hypothetical protein HY751_05425 [Nitrospinae bacterium]|nr:hypothetical protein [Nitrospinota bacterium]
MADKYYDYSKMNSVSPYQAGKSGYSKFSKNTQPQKADKAATERNAEFAKVKDRADRSQNLSAAKNVVKQGVASALSSGPGGLESLIAETTAAKISTKA